MMLMIYDYYYDYAYEYDSGYDDDDDDDEDGDDDDDDDVGGGGGGKVCWDGCSWGSPCLGVVAESLDSSMGVVSKLIRKQSWEEACSPEHRRCYQ